MSIELKKDFLPHIYGEKMLDFSNEYNKQLISTIELIRRGDKNGRAVSNRNFGWQSNNLPVIGIFKKLKEEIIKSSYDFCKSLKDFEFKKIIVDDIWANINYKNDINWPHCHTGDLSGVYYVNAAGNCGDLILQQYNFPSTNWKLNKYLSTEHTVKKITAKTNKLVLFNSECYHFVEKNLSDELRISISFNCEII